MAIHSIEEPYVKVTENIRDYPTILPREGECNIGGVIVAPTGRRLAYIAGPQDFLNEFTVDGTIPRNADNTFLNAYYLSFASSLVIARSMNTTTTSGIGVYVNEKTGDFNGSRIHLDYLGNGDLNYQLQFKFTLSDRSTVSIYESGWLESGFSATTGIQTIADNINIRYEDNFLRNERDPIKGFTSTWNTELESIDLSWDDPQISLEVILTAHPSHQSDPISFSLTVEDVVSDTMLGGLPVYYKDGQRMPFSYDLTLTIPDVNGFESENPYAFIIGQIAYYHGAIDREMYDDYSQVEVNSLDDLINSINGVNGVSCIGAETEVGTNKVTYTLSMVYGGDRELSIPYTVDEDNQSDVHTGGVTISNGPVTEVDLSKVIFTIYPTNPSSTNSYSCTLQQNKKDPQVISITLNEGEKSQGYQVSLIADKADNSGNNIYIENLNTYKMNFKVDMNDDFTGYDEDEYSSAEDYFNSLRLTAPSTLVFGDSGLDLSASKSVNCMIDALYVLEDQKQYDITYFASFGNTHSQFVKTYMTMCAVNNWFNGIDVPYNYTNTNSIRNHFDNLPENSNSIALGPFDKNSGLTGWRFYLAPSTLYFERVMLNRSMNREYAPVFDETFGVVNYTNPVCTLGNADRTSLLNLRCPVNFVIYEENRNLYYFNNNLTHQSMRNLVSEENIRRVVNEIKRVTPSIVKKYKGRLNTTSTRSSVTKDMELWMNSRFFGTNYNVIQEYEIVCDSTNNTEDVINSNQLAITVKIRLQGSIKYINVLVDCFPLGVDFAQ